jgi:hypothetical protein
MIKSVGSTTRAAYRSILVANRLAGTEIPYRISAVFEIQAIAISVQLMKASFTPGWGVVIASATNPRVSNQ